MVGVVAVVVVDGDNVAALKADAAETRFAVLEAESAAGKNRRRAEAAEAKHGREWE